MRILRPIVCSQALLMLEGSPRCRKAAPQERSLSVVTLVGAKPPLRSNLRISLTARRPVWTTLDQDLEGG